MHEKRACCALLASLLLMFSLAVGAFAQEYPAKPVTVVVPYTPGSATDVIARMVSEKLSALWGQPVAVENHAGAGGSVGAAVVAKAPPDGYTLLVGSSSHVVNPALYATLPYDPQKDFVDIAPIASQPMVLFVGSSAGVKSVSELVAAAKAQPGKLKFSSPGIGSTAHLAAELFNGKAGIDAVHVPYKGGPEAIAAATDGTVTYSILPLAITLKGVRDGSLRALGVTSAKRAGELPDVPTIAEAGLAGFESTVWWGVWAPAGIPDRVADKLAKDVGSALASPELRDKLTKAGFEPLGMPRAEFARFVRSETEAAARVVKEAGIKPQ